MKKIEKTNLAAYYIWLYIMKIVKKELDLKEIIKKYRAIIP